MKSKLILSCFAFLSFSAFAKQAEIPSQFQGYWVKSQKYCKAETDLFANIEKNGFNGYEFSCSLKKITKSESGLFTGDFLCEQEGESFKKSEKFELTKDGKLKYLEKNLVKCK